MCIRDSQLSIAGAPERGKMLTDSLELFDTMIIPLALDEIGLCGDTETAPKLLRIAEGEGLPPGSEYLRVKAIEALGRMRAPVAVDDLRRYVESRKTFGWAYPDEIRMAAAQALIKLDPEWIRAFLPNSGLDPKVLPLAPLDPIPDRDFVRQRRYRRVRLPRAVPATITSARGKFTSAISVLSLDGGLLTGDIQIPVGTEATLKTVSYTHLHAKGCRPENEQRARTNVGWPRQALPHNCPCLPGQRPGAYASS